MHAREQLHCRGTYLAHGIKSKKKYKKMNQCVLLAALCQKALFGLLIQNTTEVILAEVCSASSITPTLNVIFKFLCNSFCNFTGIKTSTCLN